MAITYEPISTVTLATSSTSVVFSSIPALWTDLILTTNVLAVSTNGYPALRFNGDAGTNYSTVVMYGNGTSAVSNRYTSISELYLSNYIGGFSSSIRFISTTHIMNYASSSFNKTVLTSAVNDNVERSAGLWRNTAAITSIEVRGSNSMAVGSTFSLYGIKAA